MGKRCVFICIFLMTYTENLFLCLLAIIFGEQAVQIVYPFVNWVFKIIITGFEIF